MTPPPLTWGLPYASDSPPIDDFELPEELNHHLHHQHHLQNPQHKQQQQFYQMQQQQQTGCSNATEYDSCFDLPVLNEFLQQLLPQDTPLEDQQGWYDFLNSPVPEDKGYSGIGSNTMHQFFNVSAEEPDDDRLWWSIDAGEGMLSGGA
jgi:hypothetical protein